MFNAGRKYRRPFGRIIQARPGRYSDFFDSPHEPGAYRSHEKPAIRETVFAGNYSSGGLPCNSHSDSISKRPRSGSADGNSGSREKSGLVAYQGNAGEK